MNILASILLFAAVGCDLNDPDRDVRRLFPESTGYTTEYLSIEKSGGEPLYRKLEAELGDTFGGIYEKIDVPYTAYTILTNGVTAGYIHGANQKGKFGGMQVFIAYQPDGSIRQLTFQKLTSRSAKAFRKDDFTDQFKGLTLEDFAAYTPSNRTIAAGSKLAAVKPPTEPADDDFWNCLRGIKKNLIITRSLILKK